MKQREESTKKTRNRIIFGLYLALMIGALLVSNPPSIKAQGAQGARILDFVYVAKIYDGDIENLNFTVMNLERRDSSGVLFFFRIYADGTMVSDELSSPWECRQGFRISHGIELLNLKGPDEYVMRAELYWKNQTTAVLEDVREFRVLVVKLYVADWYQSISAIQLGARVPSTLTVSFRNGGNDRMFSASISLVEPSGLQVTPESQSIGDIQLDQTVRANFSVSAPSTVSMGSHVLKFQVSYSDFRGISQIETISATLTVTKLGASLELDVPAKVKYGYPIEVAAKLVDANGDPIKDQPIRFYVLLGSEQREVGTNITDPSGYARLSYSGILDVGDYQLKAFYEGSASHDSTTMTMAITVLPISTMLSPNIPSSAIVGQSVNITVQLTDEMGHPISGQVIEFYADNQKVGSSTTSDNGLTSTLYVPGKKGPVQLRIAYAGKGNFAGTEWSGTFSIEAIQTTLTLFVQGFAVQGDDLVFKATLKDSTGTPVQSATLSFTVVAGKTRIDQTLTTDNEGSASLPFKSTSADSIRVEAVYPGDLRYSESRATAGVMVLSPFFLGGIIVAIIGGTILGVFGLLKFKMKIDLFSWIRARSARPISQPPETKPIVSPIVSGEVGRCTSCGASMSESETYCRSCGSQRGVAADAALDEKVYSYIVEHSGVISLKQAATDLGLPPEQVKESAERLKRTGRLG